MAENPDIKPSEYRTPGEMLATAREKRGLSLAEVSEITKISGGLLAAIERDEYQEITGSLYVKSFLRSYAGAVGLDAHELVTVYEQHAGRADMPTEGEQVWEEDGASVRTIGVAYGRLLKRYVLPASLVILVVVVGLWLRGRSSDGGGEPGSPTLLPAESAAPPAATNSLGSAGTDSLAAGFFSAEPISATNDSLARGGHYRERGSGRVPRAEAPPGADGS